jgi:hypothetical protein
MSEHRRRIDKVLDPGYLADLPRAGSVSWSRKSRDHDAGSIR